MSTSPAFTATPPLSPARQRRREQILQLAERRGWLVAPRAAHIVEACHSAWKAGTLPEVSTIPSPSSSGDTDTYSDSDASSTHWISSDSSQASSSSDRIDLLCDTLKDMDVQSGKCRSSPKRKSKRVQTAIGSEQNEPREAVQKESQRASDQARSDPHSMKQVQMTSLSIASTRSSQLQRPEKTRFATGSAPNIFSSRITPTYCSTGLLSPPPRRNQLPMTRGNQQQQTRPNPFSAVQSNLFVPTAKSIDPISRTFNGQQHTLVGTQAYAHADPIDPQIPHRNVVLPRKTTPRRTTISLDQGVDNQGLKNSREWLQPGPFFKTRDESARKLMRMFDRVMFNGSFTSGNVPKVTLEWNSRLKKTAGQTRMKKHSLTGERKAVVVLSTKVIDEPGRLYKTLAHELCHAAAWIIDNTPKPPHGEVFKAWGERFRNWDNNLKITRCHDYEIHYKYNYTCVKCGKVYGRHSKSIDTSKKVCGVCKSSLQLSVAP